MFSTTPLLAHLAKSGTKVNIPEIGDTKIQVPGVISPVMEVPYPFFSFYSAPQGLLAPVNSWIYSEQILFNVTALTDLIVLGPGLWDISIQDDLQEAGAVSDATSFHSITYFATDGTGSTIALVGLTNKQGVSQHREAQFKQLVTSDQSFQFRRSTVVGLGTGLNIARTLIIAVRLF
jgi:hypothetical protein